MPDTLVIEVLGRLRAKTCVLAEFRDLALTGERQSQDWAPKFVAHPLATLIRWGLIDAYHGFTPLTADEVLHVSTDDRVWQIEFRMSSTADAIEQALGRNIWSSTSPGSSAE